MAKKNYNTMAPVRPGGIRPTGKKVEITGVNISCIVDGRIVEHGGAANLLEPLLEIGAIRVMGDGG